MQADRFDHLFLSPSNYDATLAFYRDSLGWAVTASWGGNGRTRGCTLSGGGVAIAIAEPQGARWFVVRDPDDNLIAYNEAPKPR